MESIIWRTQPPPWKITKLLVIRNILKIRKLLVSSKVEQGLRQDSESPTINEQTIQTEEKTAFSLYYSAMNPFDELIRPFWTFLVLLETYCTLFNLIISNLHGPFWTFMDQLKPYLIMLNLHEPSWTFMNLFKPYESFKTLLDILCTIIF